MSEDGLRKFLFRDDSIEREQIAERNKQAAENILKQAGIEPSHPDYERYYALTLSNVHNAGRYGFYDESTGIELKTYDETVEKMFVETLKDPEMSISQYEEATKLYRKKAIEGQQKNAAGSIFANKDESYDALVQPYNETLRSGVQMRTDKNPSFPQEFYDEKGFPTKRLVVEFEAESAWNVVNSYADKHRDAGVSFNGENFEVNGQQQSPGAFFNSKARKLDKFVAQVAENPSLLDLADDELMGLIEKGDVNGLKELNKSRGMMRDNRNKPLRELLKADPDLLKEAGEMLRVVKSGNLSFTEQAANLSKKMKANAELFHKETEVGKFHVPTDDIDRIMFSVRPSDVARQSTFQDWKSCMNAVGCNHHYVDDSIGAGSIIAYGYNSKNPQKMVSRLLIHPYQNENGDVLYHTNPKIYGEYNQAFKDKVNEIVNGEFNKSTAFGRYTRASGLYDDGGTQDIFRFPDDVKELDLSEYHNATFEGYDFSKYDKVVFGENATLKGVKLPKNVQFDGIPFFYNMALPEEFAVPSESRLNNVTLPKNIKMGTGVHLSNMALPDNVAVPDGASLYNVSLPKDVRLGKQVSMSSMTLPEGIVIPDDTKLVEVVLPENVSLGRNIKFERMNLQAGISVSEGSILKKVRLSDNIHLPKGIECNDMTLPNNFTVPDEAVLYNVILPKDVKLGKNVVVKNMVLDGVSLPPDIRMGNKIRLENMTLPEGFVVPDGMVLDNVVLPKDVKFGGNVRLENMTLPEGFVIPDEAVLSNVTVSADTRLGKNVRMENMELPDGFVLSEDASLNNVVLAKNVRLDGVTKLERCILSDGFEVPDGVFLKKVSLPKNVHFGKNVFFSDMVLPEGIQISESQIVSNVLDAPQAAVRGIPSGAALPRGYAISDNTELSGVILPKDVRFGQNVKLENMTVDGISLPKDVRLGEKLKLKNMTLDGAVLPKDAVFENVTLKNITLDCSQFCQPASINKHKNLKVAEDVVIKNSRDLMRVFFRVQEGANVTLENGMLPEDLDLRKCSSLKIRGENFSSFGDNGLLPSPDKIEINTKGVEVLSVKDLEFLSQCKLNNVAAVYVNGGLPKGTALPAGVMVLSENAGDITVVLPEGKNLRQAISGLFDNANEVNGAMAELARPNVKIYTAKEFAAAGNVAAKAAKETAETMEQKLTPAKAAAAESMDKIEQKLAAKGSVKAAAMTAEQVAEKAAKKSGILAQAATANAKFDKAIDKAVDKSAEVLNNTAVGKAYDKAAKAVGETKAAKAVGKAAEKVGEKAAQTAVGKAVTKTVAKTAGTAVGKSVLKKIPLVSLGAGMWFAWDRLKDGDWKGACGEVASGALGCIPGLGTAASTAIDVGLAAKDITAVVQENKQAEKKQEMLAQAQLPKKVTAEMKAEIAARGEVKAETKEPKEKEISAENAVQLAMAQKAATR